MGCNETVNEILGVALGEIERACEAYVSGEIDDEGLRGVLVNLPAALWNDPDSLESMLNILLEDEDLYDVSLEKKYWFSEFIVDLLPTFFWEEQSNVLRATEIIIDSIIRNYECASSADLESIFEKVPESWWDDSNFALTMVDMVVGRESGIEDLNCIDSIFPDTVFKDKHSLLYTVRSITNETQANAAEFRLFPRATWEDRELVFMILSNLDYELRSDRYLFTMYPVFRGSNTDYLESFFYYVPDKFKTDKEFALEFLSYTYFHDDLKVLFDWMDGSLWYDKDVVLKALECNVNSLLYVPRELAASEEVRTYIDENIDLEYDLGGVPNDSIPEWIKELR